MLDRLEALEETVKNQNPFNLIGKSPDSEWRRQRQRVTIHKESLLPCFPDANESLDVEDAYEVGLDGGEDE